MIRNFGKRSWFRFGTWPEIMFLVRFNEKMLSGMLYLSHIFFLYREITIAKTKTVQTKTVETYTSRVPDIRFFASWSDRKRDRRVIATGIVPEMLFALRSIEVIKD